MSERESGLPGDARDALSQLLGRAAGRAAAGDAAGVRSLLGSVESVAQNRVPDADRRERLLHGCERARAVVDDEPAVAAEYLETMRDSVR